MPFKTRPTQPEIEAARRRGEQLARDVVESAPNAIVIIDGEGNIELVNRTAEQVFGYPRSELIGAPVDMLVPERFRKDHAALRRSFLADPQSRPMGAGRDLYAQRRDGSEFLVEIGLNPLDTEFGNVVLASIVDITERKRLERELVETTELLTATLDAAPFPILVTTPDGNVLMWNRAGERIFGYTSVEMVGSSFMKLVPPEMRDYAADMFASGLAQPRPQGLQVPVAHKDGRQLSVKLFNAPIFYADGRIRAMVTSFEDVTQREATENQLRQAQKMEAIGHLTGGVAHDFNNLLGIIIGNLDLLRAARPDDAETTPLIDEAIEASVRGADLTRRMLAFARRQPLQPQRIDLNELVRDTTKFLSRVLREDIPIDLQLAGDVWPVLVDPAQLQAALTNLATNARDAMPRGGRLAIATANSALDADYAMEHPDVHAGDYALITVTDTGSGIAPDVLPRIFEPFFSTKARDKGTGLGLSMVFGFVKQSGGHISVYSEVGIGTTFRIYLPRLLAAGNVEEMPAERRKRPPPIPSGRTVLAVEDNAALRRVVVRQLTELGYRVLEADSAVAAIALLEREPVDLLFTDVVMPGRMDGYELANVAMTRWPALKVVMTSGFPEARVNEGAPTGFRLLNKPYRKEDLGGVLQSVLKE